MLITPIMYYTEYADDCQCKIEKLMKMIINIGFIVYLRGLRRRKVGTNIVSLMCFFAPAREGRRSARKSVLILGCFYKTGKLYRRVRLGCRDVDYVVKLWDKEDLSGLSYNAGAWAKFGRPKKRLRFLRAAEFGRARMAEPRASGPAALFALWVVFEAAVLIYGDVYDALKLYAQKARGSRGRDPEEPPRGGGDERPRAC
jgi:hypothetical protein